MIKFKKLSWSNAFSYGPINSIDLCAAPLTQLIGKNGYGKSSIALILEEVLFNSNSKKIKKGDILNRYSTDKYYSIELEFEKDGTLFTIRTLRGATTTVKLLRNGEDISSHTATGTYKTIENILGYDSRTFAQIVYQSSVSSLEFLTATDTARKKFLIDLLNLSKYTKASEVFKELSSDCSKLVDVVQGKIGTVSAWLAKYKDTDLNVQEIVEELPAPVSIDAKAVLLEHELENILDTNKKITTNNTYISVFEKITLPEVSIARQDPTKIADLRVLLAEKQKALKDGVALSTKCTGPTIKCPTCSQDMDNSTMFSMVEQFNAHKHMLDKSISDITKELAVILVLDTEALAQETTIREWEKYHALIDPKLPKVVQNKEELITEIKALRAMISDISAAIMRTRAANKLKTEHNSKVKVIAEQLVEMNKELDTLRIELTRVAKQLSLLQILVKAFSTTGLVAYKIECMVKDLESITNEYLGVLADGRFQLSFKIAASDKLNVVITDNGRDIDILALSSGERARVNVATLLAIRKLMQTLSNSRTNLLILDETVENLDADGKEKLIEVLLAEESLNTFLVSHGFSHPLLEKIHVVKENNISRLE